ncbi:alpha/beta hydrolase [Mesorhizobium sp. Z1-4]|uniref:alpha/beta hydrolase n=1 Tax=Mesorhizobium sp. Z1-4 TaxID=2448478 RepID=UPI000FD8730F|nr:alpha/beta hydrolase [Mesorhizobium sp. Z1-4]
MKFNEIIFAAADISTSFFRQKEEAPFDPNAPISSYAQRITIYSSEHDRPLGLSRKLHRDQRLGLADQSSIYVEPDIIAIDASLIDPAKWYQKFSFATRHSYVFDKEAGVRDLTRLLKGEDSAARPGMARRMKNQLEFWVLSP